MDETQQLGPAFDLAHAPELKNRLRMMMEGANHLTLDLRWVEKVDVAGLQLLVAAAADIQAAGGQLTIWPADIVERATRVAGLESVLGPLFDAPTGEVW